MPILFFGWALGGIGITWAISIASLVALFFLKIGSMKLHRLSKTEDGLHSPLVIKMEMARRYLANEVTMTGGPRVGGSADVHFSPARTTEESGS